MIELVSLQDIYKIGFNTDLIPEVKLITNITMRMSIPTTCEVLSVSLAGEKKFFAISAQVVPVLEQVAAGKIKLLSFGNCEGKYRGEFNAFLFSLADGFHVYGIPEFLAKSFPGLSVQPPFEEFEVGHIPEMIAALPDAIRPYVTYRETLCFQARRDIPILHNLLRKCSKRHRFPA